MRLLEYGLVASLYTTVFLLLLFCFTVEMQLSRSLHSVCFINMSVVEGAVEVDDVAIYCHDL